MTRKYFKLFSNCIIVKGQNRATICDLQRNKFVFIPNSLTNLFDSNDILDLKKLTSLLDEESLPILQEYIDLLNEHEFIFECSKNEAKLFLKLSLEFDYPSKISNAVIDFDKNSKHDFIKILNHFLIPTNCRHIQFRFYDEIDFDLLKKIILEINNSFIKSVEIIVKYSLLISNDFLSEWVSKNKKIKSITIHSATQTRIIKNEDYGFGIIVEVKQEITNKTHCGVIHHNYFNTMIESFTESQHHNSCLNRKLSIDVDGNIKNCPSMPESFGNVKDTTIEETFNHPEFTKYWNVTKDIINVCKDCELRHICTDCRAYTERTHFDGDIDLSKPLKCGYSPYTNEWEEWSTNPLKEKAIEYYGMQDLVNKNA
jgi:SPASM domain peptide maturase of grasp-with-spasm system